MAQKIDLFSPLSPEAIARNLKAIMEDDMPGKDARILGKGTQYDMRLYYVRGRRDNGSLGKQLVATMEPERGGTRIKGTIKRSYGMFGFMFLWFGFLIFFMTLSNSFAFLTPEGFNFFNAIFFFGPLFMIIFGIYFFRISLFQGSDDDVHILEFLKTELQAKDSTPQYKVY